MSQTKPCPRRTCQQKQPVSSKPNPVQDVLVSKNSLSVPNQTLSKTYLLAEAACQFQTKPCPRRTCQQKQPVSSKPNPVQDVLVSKNSLSVPNQTLPNTYLLAEAACPKPNPVQDVLVSKNSLSVPNQTLSKTYLLAEAACPKPNPVQDVLVSKNSLSVPNQTLSKTYLSAKTACQFQTKPCPRRTCQQKQPVSSKPNPVQDVLVSRGSLSVPNKPCPRRTCQQKQPVSSKPNPVQDVLVSRGSLSVPYKPCPRRTCQQKQPVSSKPNPGQDVLVSRGSLSVPNQTLSKMYLSGKTACQFQTKPCPRRTC